MDYPEDDYEKRNPKKKAKKSKYEDLEDDDDDKELSIRRIIS